VRPRPGYVGYPSASLAAVRIDGIRGCPEDVLDVKIRILENAVEVPYTQLSAEVLQSLAEEFASRDGTDYGAVEKSLEEKVALLIRELAMDRAKIFFDSESETINIVAAHEQL